MSESRKFDYSYLNAIPHEHVNDDSKSDYSYLTKPMSDKEKNIEKFKKVIGIDQPGFAANFTGGMLHGAAGIAKSIPDMHDMIPEGMQNALPYKKGESPIDKFDAYKAMGTEDKPITSLAGLEQTAGELFAPGKAAKLAGEKVYNSLKEGIPNLIEKFSPKKSSNELLEHLSQGSKNTEQNTQSIVKDIQNAHNMHEAQAVEHLSYPLKTAGEERIYEHVDPLISTKMDNAKSMISKVKDLDVGALYHSFKEKPTFQNAHNLQSELGVMIGDLKRIPGKTNAERLQLNNLKSVRDKLKGDITDFLQRRDLNSNENLSTSYKKGVDLYRENVSPYLSSKKLRQIVREGRTSVPNVHKIFEAPYDLAERMTGKTKEGPITKILKDLPQETKDKIIFNKIGGFKNANNPEKVASGIKNADQQGYSSHISQDVKNKLLDIENKSKNQKLLKMGGKGLGVMGVLEELIRRNY